MFSEISADAFQQCAARIDASIRNVFQRLGEMAAEVQAIWAEHQAIGRAPDAKALAALRPRIQSNLDCSQCPMHGTGVVLEPGVLADRDMYLEWWYHGRGGKVALRLRMDIGCGKRGDGRSRECGEDGNATGH